MTDRKFVRAIAGAQVAKEDAQGTVQIRIGLLHKGKSAVGNINRSVSIRDATVSEVMEAIQKALFHD